MGYTHYFTQRHDFDDAAWTRIREDARALMAASPAPLVYGAGSNRPPLAGEDHIRFNGKPGCENFLLMRVMQSLPSSPEETISRADVAEGQQGNPPGFGWCKTNREPYDRVVVALLACVVEHAGDEVVSVESDGNAADWRGHLSWGSGVLGRPLRLPRHVRRR